jgi:hypothetical protein
MVWLLGFPQGDSKIAHPTFLLRLGYVKGLISVLLRAKYYKSRDEKRIGGRASEMESSGLTIHHAGIKPTSYGQHCVEPHRGIKEKAFYGERGSFFRLLREEPPL